MSDDAALHILVVDDEPDLEPLVRQRLRRQVRAGRYALHFAPDGLEALRVLAATPQIEMVVTDINMPRMDGLTLLSELGRAAPQACSVVVSAYGDMANIRTAMNRGAFDFLTKPFDLADFEATLERTALHVAHCREARRSGARLTALEHEHALAAGMQRDILPGDLPSGDAFDLHAALVAAEPIGGDFFEALILDHGRIGLCVAEVSGSGLPAALFMMTTRTVLRGAAIGREAPADVLHEANLLLKPQARAGQVAVLAYALYDPRTGRLRYATAGPCVPLLVDPDGSACALDGAGGPPLGLKVSAHYRDGERLLAPGATLVLHSDGMTEAVNASGDQFGCAGLAPLLRAGGSAPAREVVARAMAAVRSFTGDAPPPDDRTCLALHRRS